MGTGGIFGGICADKLHITISGQVIEGWRWAFLLQVPFIVVSAVLVYFLVDIPVRYPYKSVRQATSRVDFLGAGLLVVAVTTLLLGLNTGGNQLPWVSDPAALLDHCNPSRSFVRMRDILTGSGPPTCDRRRGGQHPGSGYVLIYRSKS